ncbi:hypothetical protein [Candidatus Uabimicrobium sp. HlEnr_7]|uniref:hypothetical protein n=1 Tax=Candidatus Uabimicrobium helgolandensis TaxID=3095367 RepID=UPI0035566DE8
MKHILIILSTVCLFLQAQTQKEFHLLDSLPQKTLAAIWCPDAKEMKDAFLKSDLYLLYTEQEVQEFLAPMREVFEHQIRKEMNREFRKIKEQSGVDANLDTFLNAIVGEAVVAVVDLDLNNRRMPVRFAFSVEVSDEIRQIIDKLIAPQTQTQKLGELEIHTGRFPGCYTWKNNTLLYASTPELMSEINNNNEGLSSSTQFQSVMEKIAPEGEVTSIAGYINSKDGWALGKNFIPPFVDGMLGRSAIYDLENIGFSSNFSGRDIHSHFFMHLPNGKNGLFKLTPTTPVDVKTSAKKFPKDTMAFTVGNMDLTTVMNEIEKILRDVDPEGQMGLMQQYEGGLQFLKQNANIDMNQLADALEGTVTQGGLLHKRGMLPSSVAVYTIKNRQSLESFLQSLANTMELDIKSTEQNGRTIHYFSSKLGQLGNNPFDPRQSMRNPVQYIISSISYSFSGMSYAIENDSFYLSDSAQALGRYLKWSETDGPSLADSDEFVKSTENLDSSCTMIMYFNQKLLLARWWNTALHFIRLGEGILKKQKIPFHSALLPSHDVITKHIGRATLEFNNPENGIYFTYKGQAELVITGSVVIGAAILMLF